MPTEPPPNVVALLQSIKKGLKYEDDLAWFDPSDLRFVEAIDRGSKSPVYAFRYEPTGRHLFIDDRGRTYHYRRPTDPAKAAGSFSLCHWVAQGIERLQPECRPRDAFGRDEDDYEPWILGGACSTGCYGDGVRREITQRELRNQSGEIMRALEMGDEFVVTRNGVPVGELLPLQRSPFVRSEILLEAMRGAPHVDFRQLRADLEAIASYDPTPRV